MDITEALTIVIELAERNQNCAHRDTSEGKRQAEAFEMVQDWLAGQGIIII